MAETKESLQKKQDSYIAKRNKLIKKRDRLHDAYHDLKDIKENQEAFKKRMEKKISGTAEEGKWMGGNYGLFVECGNAAAANAQKIYNNIDKILDDINRQKAEVDEDIDWLWGQISKIGTAIQNWVN